MKQHIRWRKSCVLCLLLRGLVFSCLPSLGQSISADLLHEQCRSTTQLRHQRTPRRRAEIKADLFLPYSYYATKLYSTLDTHLEAIAIGDFNSDGRNDVALTTSFQSDIFDRSAADASFFIFLQEAEGRLSEPVRYPLALSITTRAPSIAAGDLKGDGRTDLVLSNYDNLQVFTQTRQGTLRSSLILPTPDTPQVVVGDVNGDGRLYRARSQFELFQKR